MKFEINEQLLQIKIKLHKLVKKQDDLKSEAALLKAENEQLKQQLEEANAEIQKYKNLPPLKTEISIPQNNFNNEKFQILKMEINNCINEIDQMYKLINEYE